MGAKVLCRFEKITVLEVVTGNANVGNLPTFSVGYVQGGMVEEFHSPESANSSARPVVHTGRAVAEGFSPTPPHAHWIGPES